VLRAHIPHLRIDALTHLQALGHGPQARPFPLSCVLESSSLFFSVRCPLSAARVPLPDMHVTALASAPHPRSSFISHPKSLEPTSRPATAQKDKRKHLCASSRVLGQTNVTIFSFWACSWPWPLAWPSCLTCSRMCYTFVILLYLIRNCLLPCNIIVCYRKVNKEFLPPSDGQGTSYPPDEDKVYDQTVL
jgi:hypothetical protein